MTNDPFNSDDLIARESESTKRMLLAVVCAVAITALLLGGYAVLRKRHLQHTIESAEVPVITDSGPKGPVVAHIVIDEPLLEKGVTTIGGKVKNISKQELKGLSIALELRRRKDGGTEQARVPVEPSELQPDQEGAYSLKLPAQNYGSIKLIGLQAEPESTLIAYSSSPGKKRPPERIESKTIVVKRPTARDGEFINTPDNPTRVP
jgi:hypothetical protein